jgi:hypothetical protein
LPDHVRQQVAAVVKDVEQSEPIQMR